MSGTVKTNRLIGEERVSRIEELSAELRAWAVERVEQMNRWSPVQRKKHSKAISAYMTGWWANASPEKREAHRKAIKDALSERYPKRRKS